MKPVPPVTSSLMRTGSRGLRRCVRSRGERGDEVDEDTQVARRLSGRGLGRFLADVGGRGDGDHRAGGDRAERPTVFQALTSGSSFQPLTRLACNDSMSLTLKLARAPVWTSGMLKNR